MEMPATSHRGISKLEAPLSVEDRDGTKQSIPLQRTPAINNGGPKTGLPAAVRMRDRA